jgi:hypothetical protein
MYMPWRCMGIGCVAQWIFSPGTGRDEYWASGPGYFKLMKIAPGARGLGDIQKRSGPFEKYIKIYTCRESNLDSSEIQPVL